MNVVVLQADSMSFHVSVSDAVFDLRSATCIWIWALVWLEVWAVHVDVGISFREASAGCCGV